MKKSLLPIVITCFVLLSCQRQSAINGIELDGNWRMVIVEDNASGATISKPSSITGDVDIIFTTTSLTGGIFSGKTPANTIMENSFHTSANQTLSIPALSMTKVMETSWGNEFVANIRNSIEYSFDLAGRLAIKTIAKTLVFEKL